MNNEKYLQKRLGALLFSNAQPKQKQHQKFFWVEIEDKRKRFKTLEERDVFINEKVAEGYKTAILLNTNADVISLLKYDDNIIYDNDFEIDED